MTLYPKVEKLIHDFAYIGSVWLLIGEGLQLRRLHRTSVECPFEFRSPMSAPSVGCSGGARRSAPIEKVGSSFLLHSPTQHD